MAGSTARPDGQDAVTADREHGGRPRRRRQLPFVVSVLLNVIVALAVVAVVQAFLVKVYSVPSGSMENTLQVGDRMLVNRLAYGGDASPERQDVVVFNGDEHWAPPIEDDGPVETAVRTFGDLTGIGVSHDQALVKRVIGRGGEVVECCTADGRVTVDGEPLDEPYIHQDLPYAKDEFDCSSTPRSPRCFGPISVPEGKVLAIGDHRANSADSVIDCRGRSAEEAGPDCVRFVDEEDVVGEVFVTIWPPAHWSTP